MASSKNQALILLLLSLIFTFSSIVITSHAAGFAIYWGQNANEGSLTTTCDVEHYEIVNLAFLNTFGEGRIPKWNFAGHCGDWSPCTKLEPEIKYCQQKGKKVFLSLGGADVWGSDYGLSSPEDAKEVANYLYNNFLSGQYGPLGSVTLDGIDFDIEKTELYWDDLARELDALRQPNKKFYLSAAPQCPIPIYYLGKAIETHLFDYVFVQFYNNPGCSYTNGNVDPLLKSWDDWVNLLPSNNSLFMGLPAGPDAAGLGYIEPEVMVTKVCPYIKQTANYGGIMLWDRYHDVLNNYSEKIKSCVESVKLLQTVTAVSNAISECVSAALHRILPKPKPL